MNYKYIKYTYDMEYDYEIFYVTEINHKITNVFTEREKTVSYNTDNNKYFRNTDRIYYFSRDNAILSNINNILNRDIKKDYYTFQLIEFIDIERDYNEINKNYAEIDKVDIIKKNINSLTNLIEIKKYIKMLNLDNQEENFPWYYDDLERIYKTCVKMDAKYLIIGISN